MSLTSYTFIGALCLVGLWSSPASADISCYYCGPEKLCPLPFPNNPDPDEVSLKQCSKACMKFDGYSEDNESERVLVRDCADVDDNICEQDKEHHGARGDLCVCNGENCNASGRMGADTAVAVTAAAAFLVLARRWV